MSRPQVIDEEEHERVHERVAAVDVAKDSGVVCARTPHPSRPGARQSAIWTVRARMGAIGKLGRQLKKAGIEIVTLESTSDYWRIWFFVLEAAGLAVQLVSAAQAKNLPGRPKSGKQDAMWLARLTEMGLLRASFVPPAAIRDLRDYTRARTRLVQERTRCWQRLEKLLEGAQIKLSSVASTLTTESAKDMIKAMIAGQRDPHTLAALGQAATGAARTATFLGERYSRIARRRGKAKAQVAVARSILVIIWHLLADPTARYTDLGHGYYQARTDTDRKIRNHIRQIEALGFTVTLTKAA